MKRYNWLIIALLWCVSLGVEAASSLPTITKSYRNVPLSEVLQSIEKKTHYTILYDTAWVDGSRLINTSFDDTRVTTAVKRLFGKNFQVKAGKNVIRVTYIQPEVAPTQIDSIRQTVVLTTQTRLDSVAHYSSHQELQPAAQQPEPLFAHAYHGLILGLGTGYGEVIKHGHAAAQGDLSYAFFWNEHWGFSLGIGADCYHSIDKNGDASIYTRSLKGYTDTDHEIQAELLSEGHELDIRHTLVSVNMPVMLQMEYKWVYGSLGARIGYPVVHTYKMNGEYEQWGYYDKWDLTLEHMHEYGDKQDLDKGEFPVQTLTVAPQAELGVVVPVGKRVSSAGETNKRGSSAISIGAYANVSVWNRPDYLPWQAGVKIAYRYREPAKPQPRPTVYEMVTVVDTTWTIRQIVDTIRTIRYDTIMRPAEAIARVMERSIIWFDLDKTEPKVDPVDMLDEIAAILVAHPEQIVELNGHTCDLGNKAYNEDLSKRRAQAVKDLLIKKGVRPGQMVIHAYANSKPYYSKSHDRYLDRRVEIVPIIGSRL